MRKRTHAQPGTPARRPAPRRGRLAMTLIELLVVISIITLLISILVPAFGKVKQTFARARSQKRVVELSAGITQFAADHKGLYPGQLDTSKIGYVNGAGPPYTGSQVLALCMFFQTDASGTPDPNYLADPNKGSAIYAPCNAQDDLFTFNGKAGTIWDQFSLSDKGAICYYPSRLGMTGFSATDNNCQFSESDNSAYTDNPTVGAPPQPLKHPPTNNNWVNSGGNSAGNGSMCAKGGYLGVADNKNFVVNPGKFLLLGAGPDGIYGTPDDVKNFSN